MAHAEKRARQAASEKGLASSPWNTKKGLTAQSKTAKNAEKDELILEVSQCNDNRKTADATMLGIRTDTSELPKNRIQPWRMRLCRGGCVTSASEVRKTCEKDPLAAFTENISSQSRL